MSGALLASRAFLVLLGPFAGDYAATLASAWPRAPRPVLGRSHCGRCGAAIAPSAQIPLVSWALQRGRRNCCGGRIPIAYPLGEVAGLATGVAAACAEPPAEQAWIFALGLTLTYIGLVDLRRFSIPVLGLAALGLEVAAAIVAEPNPNVRLARLATGGVLALAFETLRRFGARRDVVRSGSVRSGGVRSGRPGLGAGDVMLAGLLGALVGWRLAAPVVSAAALAPLVVQRLRRKAGPVAFGLWLNIAAACFLLLVECNLLVD